MTKRLRRPSGKISMLPVAIRTKINIKLRNGWKYRTIIRWLFTRKARTEIPDLNLKAGESFSLAWSRASRTAGGAEDNCKQSLSSWFNTHYREWLREEAGDDRTIRLLKGMQELCAVASETAQPGATVGGNMLIQSILLDTIKLLHEDKKDPAELARLANAWARLNQTATENEKLKLRTEDSLDVGLKAISDEIQDNPEALALFNKLRDAVKGPAKSAA